MKCLLALFATLLIATMAMAQQSSGPVASPAELAKLEQQRAVTQPYNNAPIWKTARGAVEGYVSIPAPGRRVNSGWWPELAGLAQRLVLSDRGLGTGGHDAADRHVLRVEGHRAVA